MPDILYSHKLLQSDINMKKLILLSSILLISACAGHPHPARVEVAKSDLSRQCESAGISPEIMQNQLQGIHVYAARKDRMRGMMFPAVCGGETGRVNVYTIAAGDVQFAGQHGFFIFKTDEF